MPFASLDEIRALVGQEIGVSSWLAVDQDRIDSFAEATEDRQFAGTFIADAPGVRVAVVVRENGNLVASGEGEAIVVIRTPLGAQLQAMAASVLQRRP